jgi:hypothetical protein
MNRRSWAELTDSQLLAQCAVDTYRASGPGGQKRNKTSSAVRLRHTPSGLLVIAEESRSQHENKAKALVRLRQALYLELREPVPEQARCPGGLADHPDWQAAHQDQRIVIRGVKDPRFWPAVGLVLDVLVAAESRVSDAAEWLGVTTGQLVDLLQLEEKVWQQANQIRARFGQKPLR